MTALNRYTCEEAFRRLDDYLDRELSASEMELIREHLVVCEACAREFEFERSLLDRVGTKLRQFPLPDGLQDRVQSIVRRARTAPKADD
ncbi:MAG: anti-sigma factor family protein [Gemmatimonadaceae bacterium]